MKKLALQATEFTVTLLRAPQGVSDNGFLATEKWGETWREIEPFLRRHYIWLWQEQTTIRKAMTT